MASELERFRTHARIMSTKLRVPLEERALWTQLADEIDAYLTGDLEGGGSNPTADDHPLEGL